MPFQDKHKSSLQGYMKMQYYCGDYNANMAADNAMIEQKCYTFYHVPCRESTLLATYKLHINIIFSFPLLNFVSACLLNVFKSFLNFVSSSEPASACWFFSSNTSDYLNVGCSSFLFFCCHPLFFFFVTPLCQLLLHTF